VLIGLLLISTPLLFGQAFSRKVIQDIKTATVYLQVERKFLLNGKVLPSSGSGFMISPRHIATCYHVVQPELSLYGRNFPAPVEKITVIRFSGTAKFKRYPATIIAADRENDLAILALEKPLETTFLKLGNSEDLFETTAVWVFGYPFGEAFSVIQRGPEITVGKGSVSALRHDDQDLLTSIQLDAVVNSGNSGGPAVNQQGQVVGVTNRVWKEAGMTFAVPCHFLALLQKQVSAESASAKIKVKFAAEPAGASLYIDNRLQGQNPLPPLQLTPGIHRFALIKKGFESFFEESGIRLGREFKINLKPIKDMIIPDLLPNAQATNLPELPSSRLKLLNTPPAENQILLQENFDESGTFSTWEQSTGGMKKRTWFLQDGSLNQFDSDELLHAIFLGSKDWDNYVMQARVKISDEHDDSRAGLIVRDTADGFYLFRIHKETDKAQLAYHSKRPFGWFILAEQSLPKDITDQWYPLTVGVNRNRITCLFDGKAIFDMQTELSAKGRIGFYSVESKASFDDLKVFRLTEDKPREIPLRKQLHSFWFSDYFDFASGWWWQYGEDIAKPAPWYFSSQGLLQDYLDDALRNCELTKYRMKDFSARMVLTLHAGEKNKASVFSCFFRKQGKQMLQLSFTAKDQKIRLSYLTGKKAVILQEKKLPEVFFNTPRQIQLLACGKRLICVSGNDILLDCRNEEIPVFPGRFGFSVQQTRLLLHLLTISSLREKDLPGKEEKKATGKDQATTP